MVLQDCGVGDGQWASGAPYWFGNSQAGNFWGLEGTQSAHMGVRCHPSAQVGAEVLGKDQRDSPRLCGAWKVLSRPDLRAQRHKCLRDEETVL